MSEPVVASGADKQPKPRLKYADVFKPLNLSELEYEKTVLLLDGEPVIYSGHHHDSIVWLKHKGKILACNQAEVMPHLKLAPR